MNDTAINIITSPDFGRVAKLLNQQKRKAYLVYDRNVSAYANELIKLSAIEICALSIDATEANKTIETVMEICRWLLANLADRKSLLIAMGGGVTTDMAGFAASIYKRGMRYVNVPTTLLSQVDAGIGGKTGVNLDSFKNMLGVIVQPEFTYICPKVLSTLPSKEFHSGAAEMLKTFIIGSAADYESAVVLLSGIEKSVFEEGEIKLSSIQTKQLEELIGKAARIKADIVSQDPYEKGLRRVLNLGHTWGHAIEWYQNSVAVSESTHLTHGEAVAIGIIHIAAISEQMGLAKSGLKEKLIKDFTVCGLPTQMPYPEEALQEAINKDKKTENGKVHLALIKEIGSVIIQ